jgi:molybdate transport system substrate-binding protein
VRIRSRLIAVLALTALVPIACGRGGGSEGASTATALGDGGRAPQGEITVGAAASLTESFTEIGEIFEEEHPGTEITFTFDSSGSLAQQILEGAPIDAFASADQASMQQLVEAGVVPAETLDFTRNELTIVTGPGNPEGIESLADLADAGVVSLCAAEAPCGAYAAQVLANAGVSIPEGSVTRGQNAKATLTAVSEGDAVAAIVYVTDALAAGDAVDTVAIPEDQNVIATYPASPTDDSTNPLLARAFVSFLLSDRAQAVLEEQGFLPAA